MSDLRTMTELYGNERKSALFNAQFNYNYFIFDAVYSDETAQFLSNPEPARGERLTIRIRTAANNVDTAWVVFIDGTRSEMKFESRNGLFEFFIAEISIAEKINYGFQLRHSDHNYYYNKRGVVEGLDTTYNFTVIPGFKSPDWAKGADFYQINTDRLCNGDERNDVVTSEYSYFGKPARKMDWNDRVDNDDLTHFYGGDLAGVSKKLGYLKDLGIDAIYFNPLFVSPSNHKYDIQDYDYIDPHFGLLAEDGGNVLEFEKFSNRYATKYMKRTTSFKNLEASNDYFARFVEKAHKAGIKIILDGVFNHCGAMNKWLDRDNFYGANGYPVGAYRDKKSKYHDFFRWYDEAWPNNECYDSWWGHDNHPKLYYEKSKDLYNYIMNVAKKWVSPPYNCDGWRLDVAADLGYSRDFNNKFWQDFRRAVKTANPNAIILAEHYGDAAPWLDGVQWDSIMNYDAFMEPITWFLTGMEKHSEQFRGDMLCNAMAFENAMRYHNAKLPFPSLSVAMNELSNHDHSRFLTRTNMTVGRLHTVGSQLADEGTNLGIMLEAVAFQMCWLGAPTIYYGDEAGLCGWSDPDNRRPFPWGKENKILTEFHKETIKLRKQNEALRSGSLEYLFMNYGIITFGRWKMGNQAVCALNNNPQPKTVSIPVWKINAQNGTRFRAALTSQQEGFSANPAYYTVAGGNVEIQLPPYGAMILVNN